MEPSTRLDYIVFQLTPTRTRCDLAIFAGKQNEKLAHGLLDPFVSHLRSAKDQIAKGGYSVTLRAPTSAAVGASWFTKGTVLRFVRFVSTPEVLERVVTIEREIQQIENSINSYEVSNADETEATVGNSSSANSLKITSEFNGNTDGAEQESSKDRLQRVLDTRKAVLRKEQAMAYARGLAAGFDLENLDDLLCFSDAFGAARLREACMNFVNLWKKKNEDRLWMDEIAAMQACVQPQLPYVATSGIILTGDENDPTLNIMSNGKAEGDKGTSLSDSTASHGSSEANQSGDVKHQMPLPWANQLPPYMHNFQGPVYPQIPPYQGYAFPGMPHYFPGNMQWPPNMKESAPDDHRGYTSSSRKKERALKKRQENEKKNEESETSDSSAESGSSKERQPRRKHGKKSSKKVVIRNINYITSKRNGKKSHSDSESSLSDEEYLPDESLKQQVEEAVGSLGKHHKTSSHDQRNKNNGKDNGSFDKETGGEFHKTGEAAQGNGGWDALQELLMREDPASNGSSSFQVEPPSSFSSRNEAEVNKRPKPAASDSFLPFERETGNGSSFGEIAAQTFESGGSIRPLTRKRNIGEEFILSGRDIDSDYRSQVTESDYGSSIIKSRDSDEWITGMPSDQALNQGASTNLRMINGDFASQINGVEMEKSDIADDSLVIQSMTIQAQPLNDQLDIQPRFDIDIVSDAVGASMQEGHAKREPVDTIEPEELYMVPQRDTLGDHGMASWSVDMDFENSIAMNEAKNVKPGVVSDAKPKSASNGKGGKGALTRDARSRSSLNGPLGRSKPELGANNRRSTFGGKTTVPRSRLEEEERRKRMEELQLQRQKRIAERTANNQSKKNPTANGDIKGAPKTVFRSSTIERLAAAKVSPKGPIIQSKATLTKKVNVEKVNKMKPLEKKIEPNKLYGIKTTTPLVSEPGNKLEKQGVKFQNWSPSPTQSISRQSTVSQDANTVSEEAKELHITPSMDKSEQKPVQEKSLADENGCTRHSVGLPKPVEDHVVVNNSRAEEEAELKQTLPLRKPEPEPIFHPVQRSLEPVEQLGLESIGDENETSAEKKVPMASPEISELEYSSPQSVHDMSADPVSLRKKWNDSAKDSPKASKGFKQLLMFGRKKVYMA